MDWGMSDTRGGSPGVAMYGGGGAYETQMSFGGDNAGGGDRACFNCGETGHNKVDCPVPRQFSGACNNCGKEGHMSKDCPDRAPIVCRRCKKEGHMSRECSLPVVCPRCGEGHYVSECSVPMTCRVCGEEGHIAKECPSAPPRVCRNCQEEGHDAASCKAPRKVDREGVPKQTPEEALELIRKAAAETDLDDVKAAVQMYVKACPDVTYVELEGLMRAEKINLFFIGVEKADMSSTLTNMDLQGNLHKKFTVTYRFQNKPNRPREKAIWPKDDQENMARLDNGGEPVARGVPLCTNCNELGHISKNCPSERMENLEKPAVTCYNCGEEGHRIRDCKEPRVDKFACRNCGQSGHTSKECPEPRSAEGVECRKCGETGHFSRDCPQGGGGDSACRNCGQEGHMARDCTEPRKIICRNCDKEGHTSRECPEPVNMERIQCRNCDEFGHMSKQCAKPRNMDRVRCSNCQEMGHFPSTCKAPPASNTQLDTGSGADFGNGNPNAMFGGFGSSNDGFEAHADAGIASGGQDSSW